MSRIVGILPLQPHQPVHEHLAAMLGESKLSGWHCRQEMDSAAGFGWCGRATENFHLRTELWVMIDGVVYNRQELGRFDTESDLVASLYLEYGFAKTLARLNGDFGIAIYDLRTKTLWLGRDRLGVKPLYYASTPAFFAFASRPRALLTLPLPSHAARNEFLGLYAGAHYRYFDNASERSPYSEICQLVPGHIMQVKDNLQRKERYWNVTDRPDFEDSEDELAEQYHSLLLDSVSSRLRRAVRPAFTLSGGMDSSSVLASAVSITGSKQQAFSTVYEDATYDESVEIQSMLESTVETWHTVRVGDPDVFETVRELVEIHDEPVATATWLSHYLLCKQASASGVESLFGGLGGDELNAGEYEYFTFFFADLKAEAREAQLAREVTHWIEHHDHPVFRKSVNRMQDSLTRFVDLRTPGRCLPDRERLLRYHKALNQDFYDLRSFEPVMDHPFKSYLKNRAYQDLFRETTPCCLRAEDRQTTACGLDHFLPFLDFRLVEFMFRIPSTLKIREGVTKHLLRQAMRGVLPEETRTRIKKTGWNAPAHQWFAGRGKERLLDLVHSRQFRERGIYNVAEVERLIDEHDVIVSSAQRRENHMMFLWQLVNLELWLQSVDRIGARAAGARVAASA